MQTSLSTESFTTRCRAASHMRAICCLSCTGSLLDGYTSSRNTFLPPSPTPSPPPKTPMVSTPVSLGFSLQPMFCSISDSLPSRNVTQGGPALTRVRIQIFSRSKTRPSSHSSGVVLTLGMYSTIPCVLPQHHRISSSPTMAGGLYHYRVSKFWSILMEKMTEILSTLGTRAGYMGK